MSEKLDQKVIDLLDKAGENAFNVMVEQMKTNPDAIEALYDNGQVYCQWVDSLADEKAFPESCLKSMQNRRCTVCQRSPQLDLGMKPDDLLRNIKV